MIKSIIFILSLTIIVSSFNIRGDILQMITDGNNFQGIPWPFTTCQENADWKIQSVVLDQAPKRNINDDIDVTGTAINNIKFKRTQILVKLNGVFLDKEVVQFTSSFDSGDTVEFTYKNFIPSFAPSGTYGLTFQFIDSNEKNNGCLQFSFKL